MGEKPLTEEEERKFREDCEACGPHLAPSVPRLLATIDALRAEVERLRDIVRWLHDKQDTCLHHNCTPDNCPARAACADKGPSAPERK